MDWETFVGIERWQWARFLENQPGEPKEVRCHIALVDPPLSVHRFRSPSRVYVKIYLEDPLDFLFAAISRDLVVGDYKLDNLLRWDRGLKVKASLPARQNSSAGEPLVNLQDVAQIGWVTGIPRVSYDQLPTVATKGWDIEYSDRLGSWSSPTATPQIASAFSGAATLDSRPLPDTQWLGTENAAKACLPKFALQIHGTKN